MNLIYWHHHAANNTTTTKYYCIVDCSIAVTRSRFIFDTIGVSLTIIFTVCVIIISFFSIDFCIIFSTEL